MGKLSIIKTTITQTAGKSGLIVKKYSPEILIAVGITGIVASTIMACKATLKVDQILDEAQEKKDKIKTAKETLSEEKYSDQDYQKDMLIVKVQTSVDFVKLYAPAVSLGILSIGCILGGYNIIRKRNIALAAAYKLVEESFRNYRKRVIAEFGEEKDYQFKHGIKTEKVKTIDENGKEVEVEQAVQDPNGISQYARFFDESSSYWEKTPEYNLTFLKCVQAQCNDVLNSRGYLFLNEVYEMIGIPYSKAGQVVGWVKDEGDGFVDFGIFDGDRFRVRDFVNGYERSILLDFNVTYIYDKI